MQSLILLSSRITRDTNLIWEEAISQNWEPVRCAIRSLPPVATEKNRRVAVYGDVLLAGVAMHRFDLSLLETELDWLLHIPERWTKRSIEFIKIKDYPYYDVKKFIKPADIKWFTASIVDVFESPDFSGLDPSIDLLVSDVVKFVDEFRCFIADRKLQTISRYPPGVSHTDANNYAAAEIFINELLKDQNVDLPPATVIDVGIDNHNKWMVIESNPCFASGLYQCDIGACFTTIIKSCVNNANLTEDLKRWVIREPIQIER